MSTPQYQFPNQFTPGLYGYPPINQFPPVSAVSEPPLQLVDRDVPSAPDASSVTPAVATHAVQQLISSQLRVAGYKTADPLAMQRLEREVVAFVSRLYQRAHEYANLSSRSGPLVTDLLKVCEDHKLEAKQLHKLAKKSSRKRKRLGGPVGPLSTLLPPRPNSPSPDLLPSDDEGSVPSTLRALPHSIPELPPKHTYLRTPVTAATKTAVPSLEKKLKNAGLVQESLKNLLTKTEDTTGPDDAKLLGHIVNWEAGSYPRKRWKVATRN